MDIQSPKPEYNKPADMVEYDWFLLCLYPVGILGGKILIQQKERHQPHQSIRDMRNDHSDHLCYHKDDF